MDNFHGVLLCHSVEILSNNFWLSGIKSTDIVPLSLIEINIAIWSHWTVVAHNERRRNPGYMQPACRGLHYFLWFTLEAKEMVVDSSLRRLFTWKSSPLLIRQEWLARVWRTLTGDESLHSSRNGGPHYNVRHNLCPHTWGTYQRTRKLLCLTKFRHPLK